MAKLTRPCLALVLALSLFSAVSASALTELQNLFGSGEGQFGSTVAVSGTIAVVASPNQSSNTGLATLYHLGSPAIYLVSTGSNNPGDYFGSSVAASSGLVVVGAPGVDGNAGAAYAFFAQFGELNYAINPILPLSAGDQFGASVAVTDEYIVVGATGAAKEFGGEQGYGAAYVFTAEFGEEHRLLSASNGQLGDSFGSSLGISGARAIVGAVGRNANEGAAYVFDVVTGAEVYYLTASDGAAGSEFGISVAMDGDLAIVGAPGNGGAAYVFDLTTGEEIWKLTGGSGFFGASVSLSNGYAVVGAYDANGGEGAVYLYDLNNGNLVTTFTSGEPDAGFGYSVAMSGTTAVLGAPDTNFFEGAAYTAAVPEPRTAVLAGLAAGWLILRGIRARRHRRRMVLAGGF